MDDGDGRDFVFGDRRGSERSAPIRARVRRHPRRRRSDPLGRRDLRLALHVAGRGARSDPPHQVFPSARP